jgi:3-hydroxyisobutyrate dehydrogenase
MSTLGRDEILRLGAIAAEKGVRTMELPVTGGVHLAAQGQITMLAGGDKDLFDLHLPALEAMGNQIFHMGPLGNSSIIKVITNMLAFIHLKACGEALMLAKRGGLDLGQAWAAIKASSGTSFVHETEGALILNGSYDIAFNIDLALKDLGFAMEFGREFGVPLELALDDGADLCRSQGCLWRQRPVADDCQAARGSSGHRSARAGVSRQA